MLEGNIKSPLTLERFARRASVHLWMRLRRDSMNTAVVG
jgi:hypothetical protein